MISLLGNHTVEHLLERGMFIFSFDTAFRISNNTVPALVTLTYPGR
jgi:hypothetical protein